MGNPSGRNSEKNGPCSREELMGITPNSSSFGDFPPFAFFAGFGTHLSQRILWLSVMSPRRSHLIEHLLWAQIAVLFTISSPPDSSAQESSASLSLSHITVVSQASIRLSSLPTGKIQSKPINSLFSGGASR